MAWSNNSAWGANYQLADVANMLVQIFSPNCANFGILTRSTYTTTILLNTGDLLCTLLCTLFIIFHSVQHFVHYLYAIEAVHYWTCCWIRKI